MSEQRYTCPFCLNDTDKHLYVNVEKDRYFCFKCQRRGTATKLFATVLSADAPSQAVTESIFEQAINRLLYGTKVKVPELIDYPVDVRPVVGSTPAWHYLRARGISDENIQDYRLVWGHYKNADRIFFPVHSVGAEKLVYWVARKFANETDNPAKYVNAPISAAHHMFNLDVAIRFPSVIVTEGPTSAIAAGRNAIGTLGKNVSKAQLEHLSNCRFEEYMIAFDGDARKEALWLAEQLLNRSLSVSIVELPLVHDPATDPDFQRSVANRVPITTKRILEARMYGWVGHSFSFSF